MLPVLETCNAWSFLQMNASLIHVAVDVVFKCVIEMKATECRSSTYCLSCLSLKPAKVNSLKLDA